MLLRSMQKYTKELADAKAENDACVMMLPLVVVGCTSKQSGLRVKGPYRLRGGRAASPRLADTAERDYFTLREVDYYAKTTGRNPEVY